MILVGSIGEEFSMPVSLKAENATFGAYSEGGIFLFFDETRQMLFIATGRVDNRKTLKPFIGSVEDDAKLIFDAYCKWGKKTPEYLIGDWIFVAYHLSRKELFAARDQNGNGSLYFSIQDRIFSFSTCIKKLLDDEKKINVRHAISKLSLWKYQGAESETIFENIHKLPNGHFLTFIEGKLTIERYWKPENVAEKFHRNESDYSEELFELTKEATRCRIAGVPRVGSMLSGGLDSGTVAVVAADLLSDSTLPCFSHVPLFSDGMDTNRRFGDETPFIRATAASRSNISLNLLQSDSISPLNGLSRYIDCFDTIIHGAMNAFWIVDIRDKANQMGLDVLLTGKCGNLGLSYKGNAARLSSFHPSLLMNPRRMIRTKILGPWRNNRLEFDSFKGSLDAGYVNQDAIKTFGILEDVRDNRTGFKTHFATASEEMLYLIKTASWHAHPNFSQAGETEYRDPTADIRILEHCLAIPNGVFFDKAGNNKQVLRRMMKGRLPDKVLFEKRKGLQAADIYPRVMQEIDRVEEQLGLYERNHTFQYLIDTKKLNAGLQGLKSGHLTNPIQINQFLKAVMLGMFLEKHRFD